MADNETRTTDRPSIEKKNKNVVAVVELREILIKMAFQLDGVRTHTERWIDSLLARGLGGKANSAECPYAKDPIEEASQTRSRVVGTVLAR